MVAVTITQITPYELEGLIEKSLRKILAERQTEQVEADQWFNLRQLCEYLPERPAKQTVYLWVSRSAIPFHKKAKKLFFLKSEIDNWLKQGRKKTVEENNDSDVKNIIYHTPTIKI